MPIISVFILFQNKYLWGGPPNIWWRCGETLDICGGEEKYLANLFREFTFPSWQMGSQGLHLRARASSAPSASQTPACWGCPFRSSGDATNSLPREWWMKDNKNKIVLMAMCLNLRWELCSSSENLAQQTWPSLPSSLYTPLPVHRSKSFCKISMLYHVSVDSSVSRAAMIT